MVEGEKLVKQSSVPNFPSWVDVLYKEFFMGPSARFFSFRLSTIF